MKTQFETIHSLFQLNGEVPSLFNLNKHLIYSSPATLSYNAPGAKGFGVKRAALSIPESILLVVSPGCCGRNTTHTTYSKPYENRYFYYLLDEVDIVTGKHLDKLEEVIHEILNFLEKKPKLIMLCFTCVDALLGSDMDSLCELLSDKIGMPIKPSYMYALTREGHKPPMAHIQESLYSMLTKNKKDPTMINLIGYYAKLQDTELYDYLHQIGIKTINEIGNIDTYEAFFEFSKANFNIMLHPDSYFACEYMHKHLAIPSITLETFYTLDFIKHQYQAFQKALNIHFDDHIQFEEAKKVIETLPKLKISIGENVNANPFELAYALSIYGCEIKEIFASYKQSDYIYIRLLEQIYPNIKIYCNNHPSMVFYKEEEELDLTIGHDVKYYHPTIKNIPFNEDSKPFGYQGLINLINQIKEATL